MFNHSDSTFPQMNLNKLCLRDPILFTASSPVHNQAKLVVSQTQRKQWHSELTGYKPAQASLKRGVPAYKNSEDTNMKNITNTVNQPNIGLIATLFEKLTGKKELQTDSALTAESKNEGQINTEKTSDNNKTSDIEKTDSAESSTKTHTQLAEKHLIVTAGERGYSYHSLFADYLKGARRIEITDPYIRSFSQARNLMEFLEVVLATKRTDQRVAVHLTTAEDHDTVRAAKLHNYLETMIHEMSMVGIELSYEIDTSRQLHARHITTNTGWKLSLDRGLDIFQPYNMTCAFQLMHRHPEIRPVKAFEMTCLRLQ